MFRKMKENIKSIKNNNESKTYERKHFIHM